MGGLYGNAAATALEDLPEEARGLMSGILQQGVRIIAHGACGFFIPSPSPVPLPKRSIDSSPPPGPHHCRGGESSIRTPAALLTPPGGRILIIKTTNRADNRSVSWADIFFPFIL